MNVYDRMYDLVKALEKTPEAEALKKAKEQINQEEESRKMIEDFHVSQKDLQECIARGEEISKDKLEEMNKRYETLCLNPKINEFFQTQQRFLMVVEDVQRTFQKQMQHWFY